MKKEIRVAISCIGSGVGKGIIDSCCLSELPLYTIGLGTNPMAFGAYDCDERILVPEIYADDYIETLLKHSKKHAVDILIPSLDDELYAISINSERFKSIGVIPLVAKPDLIKFCRNKYNMASNLNERTGLFVKSHTKKSLFVAHEKGELRFPLIAKPNEGNASRGVFLLKSDNDLNLVNSSHVIQEIALPSKNDPNLNVFLESLNRGILRQLSEISIQLVVGSGGSVIGKFASLNNLINGEPTEIIPFDDSRVWDAVEELLPYLLNLGLIGPLNIQGRITDDGPKFFEMNARFTGITGLRALLGFNEVEALIKDFLGIEPKINMIYSNKKRVGIRQACNRSVSIDHDQNLDGHLTNCLFSDMTGSRKTVMVTGATGFLGSLLVEKLAKREEIEKIVCLVRDINKAEILLSGIEKILIITDDDIIGGSYSIGNIDLMIHTAFSLIKKSYEAIADSMEYTFWLFSLACHYQVPVVVNISSQSVYGTTTPSPWSEEFRPAPDSPYGEAKLGTELFLSSLKRFNRQASFTSLRISRLHGLGRFFKKNELSYNFIREAVEEGTITIRGGKQNLDLVDVNDAVDGILSLLDISPLDWKPVYNIGSGKSVNIVEVAEMANNAANTFGKKGATINITSEELKLDMGMNIDRLTLDTGWKPRLSLFKTFTRMMNHYLLELEAANKYNK